MYFLDERIKWWLFLSFLSSYRLIDVYIYVLKVSQIDINIIRKGKSIQNSISFLFFPSRPFLFGLLFLVGLIFIWYNGKHIRRIITYLFFFNFCLISIDTSIFFLLIIIRKGRPPRLHHLFGLINKGTLKIAKGSRHWIDVWRARYFAVFCWMVHFYMQKELLHITIDWLLG